MDGLTPAQRALRGRLGGLSTSARGHTVTAPARAAFLARFEPTDPDLSPAERARRAEAAKRLHFGRLALKSSIARKKKAARAIVTPRAAEANGTGNDRPPD